MSKYLSPPQVAEMLGIDVSKVYAWISSGQLPAVNLAVKAKGAKPRYRITQDALDEFLTGRQVRTTPKRRRRRVPELDEGPF